MRLALLHPKWSKRSCRDCLLYQYDERGDIVRRPAIIGLPVLRPPKTRPPCYKCPKIPEGEIPTPSNAIELTEQNRRAWSHYLECRAINEWPRGNDGQIDPIVRRNAGLIRSAMDAYESAPLREILQILKGLFDA